MDTLTGHLAIERAAWAGYHGAVRPPVALDLDRLVGLGDVIDDEEVAEVCVPLTRLLLMQREARSRLRDATAAFVGVEPRPAPFVVAVVGSVAVGKSTAARLLRELLALVGSLRVDLVTTDGFLLPNAELERRGLLGRKGWPESYDTGALLDVLARVRAGEPAVGVPVYSHLAYDVVPGQEVVVDRPDVLLVEGLNLLQPATLSLRGRPRAFASDYVDTSIYVDADEADLARWFEQRFAALRDTAFRDPASYFHRFQHLSDDEARAFASAVWREVNLPNLRQHVLPTRGRARVVLEKDGDHHVRRVLLRP